MKAMNILLFAILTTCSSCKDMDICKDENLTLHRVEFTGNQLKIEGFYYGNPDTGWNKIIRFETLAFYQNGILLQTGYKEYDKMESEIESLSHTSLPQKAKMFGVYSVSKIISLK